MEGLAKRLSRLRARAGLTQKEVGARLGISVSTYRDWEYGKQIKGEPYVKLAEIFDVGLLELMTGEKPDSGELLNEVEVLYRSVNSIRRIARSLS